MKIIYKFLCFLTAISLTYKAAGQNIALHKPYSLSPLPNYLVKPETVVDLALTDGKFSKGTYFWSQPTTLAWVKVPQVKITIDLGEVKAINSVTFNTCRRVDSLFNVRYPSHIFIFISSDNKYFSYAGDAAINNYNLPGPYTIQPFTLDSINQAARYVTICVIPNGSFVLCDEISVMQGNKINPVNSNLFYSASMGTVIDTLVSENFLRNNLIILNRKMLTNETGSISKILSSNLSGLTNSRLNSKNLKSIDSITNSLHVTQLRKQLNLPFKIEKCSPWDSISPFYFPNRSTIASSDYSFVIPKLGNQYGAYLLTNSSNALKTLTIKTTSGNKGIASIELFNAFFVEGANYKFIPDALIPLASDTLSIKPGGSKLIIFKVTANQSGNTSINLFVSSASLKKHLAINIRCVNLVNFNHFYLNSNVWFNSFHAMIVDRQSEAFKDLKLHRINTLIIGPGYLSPLNHPYFPRLPEFLSNCLYANKLLISVDFSNRQYRQPDQENPFLSSGWKSAFLKWYDSLLVVIKKSGFSASQVYFYPYDEVRGSDIQNFLQFATWVKSSVPEVKLYATLTRNITDSTSEFRKLLPLLDIAQIASPSPISLPELPKHKSEIWVYINSGTSSSESPYSHYRLMAWDAYCHDVTGIGFWSYAGDPRKKLAADAFLDLGMDYGVVYDGPNKTIISSRRWEAFSLGIEDYQILYLYGEKFGVDKSKAFAKEVMDNPKDQHLADTLKTKMLLELTTNNF